MQKKECIYYIGLHPVTANNKNDLLIINQMHQFNS